MQSFVKAFDFILGAIMKRISVYLCLLVVTVALGSSRANNDLPIAGERDTPLNQCPPYDDPYHPTMMPYPNDCSKYYVCFKGLAYPQQCPRDLFWSQITYRCDFKEYSNCKSYADNQDYSIQYSPFPGDCTRYYEKRVLHCPENNQWNAILQRCEPSSNGGCDPSYLPWTPQNPSTNTGIVPTAATPPTPFETESDNYLPIDPKSICRANNQNSYLPYPNDCHKFIHCGPQPTVIKCAGQLYWNANTQSCDISTAGCQWV